MINLKNLKLISLVSMGVGIAGTLLSNYVNEQKMKEAVRKEVEKERSQNEETES